MTQKTVNEIIGLLSGHDDIFHVLTSDINVIMEDNETLMVKRKHIPFSYIYWRAFKEGFPDIPITTDLTLSIYMDNGILDSKAINRLATTFNKRVIDKYRDAKTRDKVLELVTVATNTLYAAAHDHLTEYMGTIDSDDYIAVSRHPKLLKAKAAPKPYSDADIKNIYAVADSILMDKDFSETNNLSLAYRQGVIKKGQALQAVAERGRVSEIDGTVFPNAIPEPFIEGLDNPVDLAMESRAATMSAVYTDKVIALSEYTARRIQLASMVLRHVDYGTDCGSTDYIDWIVYEDHLKYLEGMYYKDGDNLRIIKATDNHLVGKEISIRWIVGCNHPDPTSVCEVCYGDMGMNVFPTTNIGHYGAAAQDQKRSQSVLSIKHFLSSVSVEVIELRPSDRRFISVNDMGIYINPEFLYGVEDVNIHIPANSATIMASLYSDAVDVMDSEPGIKKAKLTYISKKTGKKESHILNIVKAGSELFISEDLIKYARKYGLDFSNNNYVINLDKWEPNKRLFFGMGKTHTLKESVDEFINIINTGGSKILSTGTPVELMDKMFELINSTINAHFTHVATLVYAITAADPANGDYRIPRYGTPETRRTVPIGKKITSNSLGTALGYEGIPAILKDPATSFPDTRDSSAFDILLAPDRVLKNMKEHPPKTLPKTFHGEAVIPIK